MRSALIDALPTATLVAAEGFAVAFTVSWLILAPLLGATAAWAASPVLAAASAVAGLVLLFRSALRVARQRDEATL